MTPQPDPDLERFFAEHKPLRAHQAMVEFTWQTALALGQERSHDEISRRFHGLFMEWIALPPAPAPPPPALREAQRHLGEAATHLTHLGDLSEEVVSDLRWLRTRVARLSRALPLPLPLPPETKGQET